MKNKTVIILLSVLAVALYTVAVINFCLGDVLGGICFGDDDIRVTVIGSVAEMAEEGAVMHHCVYENGYYSKRRHPFSLILSAKDREGNRLETVEVSTRTLDVVQSRGVCNLPSQHHDRIVELVEKNMNLLKQAV